MSSIAEIEAAIEKLPASELDQLAHWLEARRVRDAAPPSVENWLKGAPWSGASWKLKPSK